jgi:hypothetical protein
MRTIIFRRGNKVYKIVKPPHPQRRQLKPKLERQHSPKRK